MVLDSEREILRLQDQVLKNDELRPEHEADLIREGVRGKYTKRFREGTNIVLIDPDMHELFPDSEAVNRALRDYASRKGGATT